MAEAAPIRLSGTTESRTPSPGAGLLKRVLSALVLLPVFLAIVTVGPIWLFVVTIVAVGAAGQWEFTGMFQRAGVRISRVVALLGGVVVTASFALPTHEGVAFTLVLLAVFTALLWRPRGAPVAWQPLAITVFGICYVNWLLGFSVWLRELPWGKEWVLLLIGITWLGETAAYVVGSKLGRHALAPVISPNKTVEGAVAQLVVSVVAALVAQAWFFSALPRSHAMIVGALLGIVGQVGDLVESTIKRSVGTKDTGRLIPGHGGMLDRIDSLLFNTPVLFYYGKLLTS
jgi:phosphatidate cytidylyltransferase